MKTALIILHQDRSIPGDIGRKLINRGYNLDIRRPCIGDVLPNHLNEHALVVILGGPISVNDQADYIKYEIDWLKVVLDSGKPFLGICVGMQILAQTGDELGESPGLGWINGTTKLLEADKYDLPIPHVGWNEMHALYVVLGLLLICIIIQCLIME